MQIFEQEINDGLEVQLQSSASISYACVAEPSHKTNHNVKHIKSLASLNDSDLYYVQSILVTSSWNKNDDIFDKNEVWAAKNTPEDKPTNLDHDEKTIVGHITSSWPITDDGVLIDENTPTENLPNKFHILTGSVVYRGFSSPDLMGRANNLINEIEAGTKYVSMECFFKGFDYGLINKSTGEFKILNRNSETAFLTKYLRSYGGLGEHDNYKIGRVLRNITFSGKGFVDKPANPDSIIFTKDGFSKSSLINSTENFVNLSNIGVSDIQSTPNVENNTMSLNETNTEAVAETTEVVEATQPTEASATSEPATTENNTVDLTQRVAELESQVAAQLDTIQTLQTEKEEAAKKAQKEEEEEMQKEEAAKKMKDDMSKKDEEMKKVKSELDAALEAIAGYKMKEDEMAKKEKKMNRKASLIENGIDADSADTVVEKFESMADDAFEAMTSLFAGKMPPWLEKVKKDEDKEEDKKAKEKKKASEASTDPEVLDSVEVIEEVNLGVGGETESSVDTTRAALVEFVSSRLGKK
jgi:hypothetical protein